MDNLKALRESRKITQTQLGEHIGAKKSAISLWESGKRQPDQETLVRLANFFEVTIDYLLGRNDPHHPAQEKTPANGDEQTIEFNHLWKDMDAKEKAFIISMMKTMKQRAK